jgi:hypothetical protein
MNQTKKKNLPVKLLVLTVLQQIVLIQNGEDDQYPDRTDSNGNSGFGQSSTSADTNVYDDKTSVLKTNVLKEWEDGKNIQLYIPSSVQSKIFTPDISSFRTSEEVARTDVGRGFWESLLGRFGLDVNESESYHRDLESVISTSKNNIIGPSAKNKAAIMLTVIQARRKF